jgi:hypothetical protein
MSSKPSDQNSDYPHPVEPSGNPTQLRNLTHPAAEAEVNSVEPGRLLAATPNVFNESDGPKMFDSPTRIEPPHTSGTASGKYKRPNRKTVRRSARPGRHG